MNIIRRRRGLGGGKMERYLGHGSRGKGEGSGRGNRGDSEFLEWSERSE